MNATIDVPALPVARPPSHAGISPDIADRARALRPDFTSPRGLAGFVASDGLTALMPAVPGIAEPEARVEQTAVLPRSAYPVLPSQRQGEPDAGPWRAQVGGDPEQWPGPVTEVQHGRRARQVLTDLNAESPILPEHSYQNLEAYEGPSRGAVHNAAVNASWFRSGVCDQTAFDALMERFAVSRGVLVGQRVQARPSGSPDTQIFTVVGHPLFIDDSTGRQNS